MLVISAGSAALAATSAQQLFAACMKLENGTEPKCTCMTEKFGQEFTSTENIYTHSILTRDESLIAPFGSSFTDKKTKSIKESMIPLMLDCLL